MRSALVALWLAARLSGQITGTVTSAATGQPVNGVHVVGDGGMAYAKTDAEGHYTLPQAWFRGLNAPLQTPVTFRADHYRPVTRIAPTQTGVLDVALEDAAGSDWSVPLCASAPRPTCGLARPHKTIGFESLFNLPCNAANPKRYRDVDYQGEIVSYKRHATAYYMRTMWGPTTTFDYPLADQYLGSASFIERGWSVASDSQRFAGIDVRGITKGGTHWRWVGYFGEFAEYQSADDGAARYFDSILDTMCISPKF